MSIIDFVRLKGSLRSEQLAKSYWFNKEYSKEVSISPIQYSLPIDSVFDQEVRAFLEVRNDSKS